MQMKKAWISFLLFSFEKWRFVVSSLLLIVLFLTFKIFSDTRWLFLQYCFAFSALFLQGFVLARSYFDEIHGAGRSFMQTLLASKALVLRISFPLLIVILFGCILVGFGSLLQHTSQIPWLGTFLYPITTSLFFLTKVIEVLLLAGFTLFLYLLTPLAAFRFHEIKQWPLFLYERMVRQNSKLFHGFFLAIVPFALLFSLLIIAAAKGSLALTETPLFIVSSFLLAPCLNFFFAVTTFYHLHYSFLLETKESK